MRGGLAPLRSAMPRNSQAANAATAPSPAQSNHLGPRNTRAKTNGIKIRAVSIRFIPRVRIHCRAAEAGWHRLEITEHKPRDLISAE